MKHIFISHAKEDKVIASRLAEDLRNAGHETKVDTNELTLGKNAIEFMNNGIRDAHTVIIFYSKYTEDADWQSLEIDSAVWNEVAQGGGTCIVIRLDSTPLPPLLGPKVFRDLFSEDPACYRKLLEELCKAILSEKTVSSVISEAFRAESPNPFRRLRAEFFEDRPDLHAKAFAPPDTLRIEDLEAMKPCFLEGSRGTGKSMLLLSLRARNFLSRNKGNPNSHQIFGFYLKLTRGALCNVGARLDDDSDPTSILQKDEIQVTDIASQEIIICLLECLFSEISFCISRNLISCDHKSEKALAESADRALFGSSTKLSTSLEELLEKLANLHQQIAGFIRRRFIYGEQPTVPIATFDLDVFKRVINLTKRVVPVLTDSMFVALMDEYENLFPFQQRLVNSLVKLGPPHISIKIAKKLGSGDTPGTTTGQDLQEIHDYTRLSLIYNVEDSGQRKAYQELLKHIVANLLDSEGYGNVDLMQLLPEDGSPEIADDKMMAEVAKLSKFGVEEFQNLSKNKQREKLTYYGEAAVYRVLYGAKGRHREKRFSGFNELSFLSSGIIRYFQEILGVAYHLTYGAISPQRGDVVLPPENQSKAVHFVSQHNLTTLSRNVEKHGESLKYFLMDIGDCLRQKLLTHTSEPEAARLTLEDPERLDEQEMTPLKQLLLVGVREGVFQTKEGLPAFKPKHSSDPQPSEFNICRIYAPVLEISPRLRWRTQVKCKSLLRLALPEQRAQAKQKLMADISTPKGEDKQVSFA